MRARLITTPSFTGRAPPLNPVPEPRATNGIRSRKHTRTIRLDLFRGLRQQHRLRNDPEIRQPVTLVGFQFVLRCDQAAIPGDGAEFLEDAGVHEYWLCFFAGS